MAYPQSLEVAGVPLERWDARRDLAGLLAIAGDEDVQRFLRLPEDEAGLAAISERFAEHWDRYGFGLWSVRPRDGAGAGWVGACHPLWHPEYEAGVELAWTLTVPLRGRGLMTRAARAAAETCFAVLGLTEVLAFVDPENAPSLAVVRRLGMRRAGETNHPTYGSLLQVFTLAPAAPAHDRARV